MDAPQYSPWLFAIFLSKITIYLAYAMSVGGIAATFRMQKYKPGYFPFIRYTCAGLILGLLSSTFHFLFQVISFSKLGLTGVFGSKYLHNLWQTDPGLSYKLQLAGWLGLFLIFILIRFSSALIKPFAVLYLTVSLLIATSFTVVGHTAEHEYWVRLALILHVFVAAWWAGSLYPLRQCAKDCPVNTWKHLLEYFGKQAIVLVALLIVSGLAIVVRLEEGDINNLLSSLHGNALLVKMILVLVILVIAAIQKFHLVPALKDHKSIQSLRLSIRNKLGVAILILMITALLSVLLTP